MANVSKLTPRKSRKSPEKQLARYQSMRDFNITAEPSGNESGPEVFPELPFVIQKHAATRLHYDFRLGWNGVLKSWAVTKGPSYFPGDKRLAVQVEDHPMAYGGFEGIIPKGQYGGGTVMLWDRGTWEPHVDVDEGLKKGSLKFSMHGEKMKGNWALVRMGGRAANEAKPNWLLIKEHDELERPQGDAAITESAPDSVLSGRDIDAIARDGDRVWQSNRSQPNGTKDAETQAAKSMTSDKPAQPVAKPSTVKQKRLATYPRESIPEFVAPQLASLAKTPPAGDRWIHELKLDGYRIQARIDRKASSVRLLTRTGLDWTYRMKSIADAALALPVDTAIIDGEVVVLSPDGNSNFADLQTAFQEGTKHDLIYFAFDLLHLNGHNLRDLPLVQRKRLLEELLPDTGNNTVRLSQHISGNVTDIFNKACELGTEGIVSKLASGKYVSGRSNGWLKLKCYQEQELVIGGFTLPSNGIHGVGALLLGYYKGGTLVYAGRTGTGFTQKTHRLMRDRLDELRMKQSPFVSVPSGAGRGAIWVKPELVAQVSFSNWTADDVVRQASFKGLREDKPAKSVQREEAKVDPKDLPSPSNPRSTDAQDVRPAKTPQSHTQPSKLSIRLTHPDKILDPSSGVTKQGLANYYFTVSLSMLPYLIDRPLTLVRCLDGSGKPCFYQKHKNQMLSDGFGTVNVPDKKTGKPEPYITLSDPSAIAELAQIGVLEVHPWGSRNESLEQPDRIIIDLDPDEAIDWKTIAESALDVRRRFKSLGLKSFVKTTGGKGLHVVVPIRPEHRWPEVKQFAHDFVLAMEEDAPSLFLTKMTKVARKGKIYLDYLRNERGATAVAPFSPRARAGLPVALPLAWNELGSIESPRFLVSEFDEWKKRLKRDPWKELPTLEQSLQLAVA
jgi:bifunctional non-homologous end joining protein LigD